MSKNQKTYLLLLVVALVWGAIGYQLYSHYNPEEVEAGETTVVSYKAQKLEKGKEYEIQPDYRDPFLGKIYRKQQPKKKSIQRPEVNFPAIIYKGVIEGNKRTYIISINGTQEIFQLGQTFQGITLLRANGKEVALKYQHQTKKYVLAE